MVTDEQWQLIFNEQKESGLTQNEFCESKGISLRSFCSRKSRMKLAGAIKAKPKKYNFIKVQKETRSFSDQQDTLINLRIKTKTGIAIEFPISALPKVMTILNGGVQ
jgi:hypothetical protein